MNFAILYWGTLPYILILTKECKKINTLPVKIVSSSQKIKKCPKGGLRGCLMLQFPSGPTVPVWEFWRKKNA